MMKAKKRKMYLIGFVTLIVVSIIVTSLFLFYEHEPEVVITEVSYVASITSNDTTNYTVLIPIPKRWDAFFDIVQVTKGNANISSSNISDGPAIKICGNGSVRIEVISSVGGDFSWCHNTNDTTIVYSKKNPDDAELQVGVYYFARYDSPDLQFKTEYWIDGALNGGWQWVKMEGRMD